MNEQDAKRVVEALLFSSPSVLGVKTIAEVLGNFRVDQVRIVIDVLNGEYEQSSRSFRIQRIGDGYQMRTLPMFKTWVQKTSPLKTARLSQAALETMAVVAYRQPVTRADIDHLRGVDSSGSLRNLLDKRLVRILGKDKTPGRPMLYGTSRDFLSLFNLSDLREMPTPEDLQQEAMQLEDGDAEETAAPPQVEIANVG